MMVADALVIPRCFLLSGSVCLDIEWPEGDEALSEKARSTINSLLNLDPNLRPTAAGAYCSYTSKMSYRTSV